MRKSLLIAMLPVLLGTGMVGGTFLLSNTNAQQTSKQQSSDPMVANPVHGQAQRTYYSVPLSPAQKWEYKTIRRSTDGNITDAEMNALGDQGWELASTNAVNGSSQMMFIFKRLKQVSMTNYQTYDYLPLSRTYYDQGEKSHDRKPSTAPEYRAYHLERVKAADIAEVLKSTFSLKNVVTDSRTNSLHVQCEPKMMKDVEQLIKKLDVTKTENDSK